MMKNYKFLIILTVLLLPFAYFILSNNRSELKNVSKKPASIKNHLPPNIYAYPKKFKKNNKAPRIYGRKIMGRHNFKSSMKTVNRYNPQWKKMLTNYLLKFQNPSVDVNVKVHESYILVKKNQARLIEEVIINYTDKGEYLSSFRALVDSENGNILQTFDKTTIQERRRSYPRLKPTGAIKNPPARRRK